MANTTRTQKSVTKATDTTTINNKEQDAKMEQLAAENAALQDMIAKLSARLDEMDKAKEACGEKIATDAVEDTSEYPEPDANKQIKIMSMFYGSLNLNNNSNRSAGRILTFHKFGEIKSVLYHDLVDYVNNERRFAEEGYFYILDKAAVYHLGLTNEYSHLVDGDIVNHMMDYSANELESIVSVMTDAQKESIANLFADKLYHGEELDLNKIAVISKHLPVGIEQMVQEKKDFDERAKAAKKDN